MVPDDDGNSDKPPLTGTNKTMDVREDDMLEIERCLTIIHSMTEEASDLASKLKLPPPAAGAAASEEKSEMMRALDDIKVRSGAALGKVRDMLPTCQKGATEDVTTLNQKRSRQPPSPLDVPRGLSTGVKGELGLKTEGVDTAPSKVSPGSFDLLSPGDKLLPLKYIKTGDNTKASFQKPSTVSAPPPSKGALSMESSELLVSALSNVSGMMSKAASPGCKSPKKRPSRSRRDRNRMRNKVADLPAPVIQRLLPGDTNKIPEDGYLWRKYGNKPIKTASYKRGYYKCRHFKEVKCNAIKMVQQTNGDPTTFSVTYKGEHTCQQRGNLGAGGLLTQGGGSGHEGATPLSFNLPKKSSEEEINNDDVGDGMDWPSDSASEDNAFDSPEMGEDAVDSAMSTVNTPSSPLFKMPSLDHVDMVDSHPPCSWGEPISSLVGAPDYDKLKFSPIDTCSGLDGPLLDDDTQLLKLIGEGLWEHPSDISYWYTGGELDQF